VLDSLGLKNQLEHKIAHADWVITGEGKFDQQTLSGKTVFGVSSNVMGPFANEKAAVTPCS
jgi:glycerate kinase